MQLAPGPIPTVSVDFGGLPSGPPGFADFESQWGAVFDVLLAQMDAAINPYIPPDLALPPDGNDGDLATLDTALGDMGNVNIVTEPVTMDAQAGYLQDKILLAYGAIPGEAFQPVPDALYASPGSPVVPIESRAITTFNNLTRPGDTNFYPGDQYQIAVELQPQEGGGGPFANVDVTVFGSFAGAAINPIDLCNTDENGFLTAVGTFQVEDVGDWTLSIGYYLGGPTDPMHADQVAEATPIAFTVQPLPPGAVGPPVTSLIQGGGLHPVQTQGAPCSTGLAVSATLANTTRTDASDFLSGDGWQLTVTGEPGQDILISALFNNDPLPWVNIGSTDYEGNFTLTGTMTDDYLGTWVESFQVGSTIWSGNLAFTVSPAAAA